MLTSTEVIKKNDGWYVDVRWGLVTETLGPYRWRWFAYFVAWLEKDQH